MQVLLSIHCSGQVWPFWTSLGQYDPQIWSPNIALNSCVGTPCVDDVNSETPSTNETRWFLADMADISESECDCLPDCELTEFQFSHGAVDLMSEHLFNYIWNRVA